MIVSSGAASVNTDNSRRLFWEEPAAGVWCYPLDSWLYRLSMNLLLVCSWLHTPCFCQWQSEITLYFVSVLCHHFHKPRHNVTAFDYVQWFTIAVFSFHFNFPKYEKGLSHFASLRSLCFAPFFFNAAVGLLLFNLDFWPMRTLNSQHNQSAVEWRSTKTLVTY